MPNDDVDFLAESPELAQNNPEAMARLAATCGVVDPFMLGLHDAMLSGWYNEEQGELLTGFPISAEDVALDVGCGDGGAMNFCAKRGAHVILADIDADRLAKARDWLLTTKARAVEAHATDADPLPLADATATRVVCMEVLEHVDDPATFIAELVRVGKPGALYLLTVPDPVQEEMQKFLAPHHYFEKPNHIRIFQREDFADLVRGSGLVIERRYYYGFFWAVWWLLFWQCDIPFNGTPRHPILDNWARTWAAVLASKDGLRTKRLFDRLMPKNQVIIARKPG
jgi:SAM-dependent methyltransferase